MEASLAFATVVLPMVCGVFATACSLSLRVRDFTVYHWGLSLVVGLLVAPLFIRALDATGIAFDRLPIIALSASFLVLLIILQMRTAQASAARFPLTSSSTLARIAVAALFLLILVHVALASFEAVNRPLFAWDATMNWGPKSKVWFESKELVPFVDYESWLATPNLEVYTAFNDGYPATLPLVQVWIALAIDRWSEHIVNLPWPIMLVAITLLLYGEGRDVQRSRLAGAAFAYLGASLPLLNSNVALAGLADVFVGLLLLSTLSTLFRAIDRDEPGYYGLAALFAIALITTKNEGTFWVLAIIAGHIYAMLPTLRMKMAALALAVLGAIFFAILLSTVTIGGNTFASLEVYFRPDGASSLIAKTFDTESWHLGVYVWFAALGAWVVLRPRYTALNAVGFSLSLMLAFYVFLFSFTLYARGAISGAATGRLLLQLAPAMTFFTILVWNDAVRRWPAAEPPPREVS